jgi:hypothetical protein
MTLTLGICYVVLRTPKPADPPLMFGIMLAGSGGKVTDLYGKDLIFSPGRVWTENFGLIAAPTSIYLQGFDATKAVFCSYLEYTDVVESGAYDS